MTAGLFTPLQYLLFFIERCLIQPPFDERAKGANVL
jgi:hypothetical protein